METLPDHARARYYFETLTAEEKAAAIRRMADEGHGDYEISAACGLAVEQVRQLLAVRRK